MSGGLQLVVGWRHHDGRVDRLRDAARQLVQLDSSSTAPSDAQSGVATSLDPCQLVTGSEASSLAGVSFGKGVEHTNSRNGKQCVYGANTKNVFTVEVGQASSTAVATAEWTAAQAQAKALVTGQLPPGVHVTLDTSNVSGIGDRAATVHGSASFGGLAFGFSGIYVLKGATFFAFQDLSTARLRPASRA